MFNLRALFGGRAGQRQAAEPSVLVTVECPWAGRQIRRMGTVSDLLEQRSLDELVRLLAATQDGAAYLLPAEYTLRVRTAQDENFRAAVGAAPATSYMPPAEAGGATVHLRIQVAPAWTDSSRPRASTALSVSEEEIAAAEATEAPAPVTVPEDGTPAAHVMAAAAQEGLGLAAPPPPAAVDAAIEEAAAEQKPAEPAPAMETVVAKPAAEQPLAAEEPAEPAPAMPTLVAEPAAEEAPAVEPVSTEPEPAMPVAAEEPLLPVDETESAPAASPVEPEIEQIAAQAAAEVAAGEEPPAQSELTMPVVAAEPPPARRHHDQAVAIPGAVQPADMPAAAEPKATGYIRKSDALRAQLQPKIDALDFSGLFVGNFGRRPESRVKSPRVALISPAEANKYLMLANQHRREGENEQAAHYYRTLITHYPENEDYWFLLGKTQEALGDIRQAVHALQNAQRLGHAGAREEIARLEAEHGAATGSRPDLLKMWRDDFTAQEPPAGES